MKSKTSFINPGILRNDFKSLGWICAAYLLGMLLSLPLKILMIHSQMERTHINYDLNIYLRIFQFDSPMQIILLILVPILAGLWLFRYLQTDKAADMIHALPAKRETLYNTHILAGIIFLGAPLIITALVSWALIVGLGIANVSNMAILSWLGVCLLINLLFFMTSAAVGTVTGLSTVQGVLSYILLILPAGLSILLLHNLKMYAYGFAYDYYYSTSIMHLSPLLRIVDSLARNPLQTEEVIAYLLVSSGLYWAGRYFYNRRQLETAGNAITFNILRPFFKYGVTFCSMLLLGTYFTDTQNTLAWTIFGYFLGSFLAYFLTEILLNKSLYVFQFKILKGFLIYALVIIGLIGTLHVDLIGYEKRLPQLSEVESIYMSDNFYFLHAKENPQALGTKQGFSTIEPIPLPIYTQEDSIAKIYALHQEIINNRGQAKAISFANGNNIGQERICLAYNLKNGSRIYRQYNIPIREYAGQLKPIYETREYKNLHYPIMRVNPATIKMLEINAIDVNKSVRIVDQELIGEGVAALQADVTAQTYEEMTSGLPVWAHIAILLDSDDNINLNKQSINLEWKKSFVNFEKWLKSVGEYNNARIIPGKDIEYVLVEKRINTSTENMDKGGGVQSLEAVDKTLARPTQQYILELEKKPGIMKITDLEKLEICLRQYSYFDRHSNYTKENIYNVFFVMKDNHSFAGGFTEDDAPAFIKEFFTGQKADR